MAELSASPQTKIDFNKSGSECYCMLEIGANLDKTTVVLICGLAESSAILGLEKVVIYVEDPGSALHVIQI